MTQLYEYLPPVFFEINNVFSRCAAQSALVIAHKLSAPFISEAEILHSQLDYVDYIIHTVVAQLLVL